MELESFMCMLGKQKITSHIGKGEHGDLAAIGTGWEGNASRI